MRTERIGMAFVLLAMAGVSHRVHAQAADPKVRAVVDSFFTAFAAEHWFEASRYVDFLGFERHFTQLIASRRTRLPMAEPTVESLMASDPDMPRAVAEWQLARMKRSRSAGMDDYLLEEFAGVTSFRELQSLTAEQAFPRWMEGQGDRHRARRSYQRMFECSPAAMDSLLSRLPQRHPRVHGVISPRPEVGYALYEWMTDAAPEGVIGPEPSVLRVRRTPDGWRIPFESIQRFRQNSFGMMTSDMPSGCQRRQ